MPKVEIVNDHTLYVFVDQTKLASIDAGGLCLLISTGTSEVGLSNGIDTLQIRADGKSIADCGV